MRWRLLMMGLSTVLGFRRRGFFIPYRYAEQIRAPKDRGNYSAFALKFRALEAEFTAFIEAMNGYGDALRALRGAPPPAPRFDQDWFPTLDAAAAYVLVRRCRPRRIIEIGSGHSTRFLARAVADEGSATTIVAVDPAPRASLSGLDLEIRRSTVAKVGGELFETLAPGDILSVDSSHILVPGSDVDDVLNRVLPALPSGILVHFHDIFLPDDYPESWTWRGYNEQNAVGALMLGGGYDVVFASHFVATRLAHLLEASALADLPQVEGGHNASLWLRKR